MKHEASRVDKLLPKETPPKVSLILYLLLKVSMILRKIQDITLWHTITLVYLIFRLY